MPSIPQSLLWISLVVLWLFVLVPMLISKRDAVRRTSDVALGDPGAQRRRRFPPAQAQLARPRVIAATPTGSRRTTPPKTSSPRLTRTDDGEPGHEDDETDDRQAARPVVMKVAVGRGTASPTTWTSTLSKIPGALAGGSRRRGGRRRGRGRRRRRRREPTPRPETTEYEYVEDSSGLEPEEDDDEDEDSRRSSHPAARRRRRFDTKTAAAVSARKYAFRKRVLMVMAVILVGSATAAFEVTPTAWWVCGSATAMTLLYLAYLRRQTRIEEKVRRRRMQRMARARLGVENAYDREYDLVPSRLRRPGAVVLEIDDEDPIFEHLDYAMPMRTLAGPGTCRAPSASSAGSSAVGAAAGSLLAIRGYGAVGSATRSHRVGQGFESP